MHSTSDKLFFITIVFLALITVFGIFNSNYTMKLYEDGELTCQQVKNNFIESKMGIYEIFFDKDFGLDKALNGNSIPSYKSLNDYQIENNYTFKCKEFIEEERKEICELQSFWMLDSIKKNKNINVKYSNLCKSEIENMSSTVDKLEFQFETINDNKFVIFIDEHTNSPEYLSLRDVDISSIKQTNTIFGKRYRFCLIDKNDLKACVYRVDFDDIMKYFDEVMGEIEKEIDKELKIKSLN